MDPISPQLEAVFSQGTNVGVLAQELFPGGDDEDFGCVVFGLAFSF